MILSQKWAVLHVLVLLVNFDLLCFYFYLLWYTAMPSWNGPIMFKIILMSWVMILHKVLEQINFGEVNNNDCCIRVNRSFVRNSSKHFLLYWHLIWCFQVLILCSSIINESLVIGICTMYIIAWLTSVPLEYYQSTFNDYSNIWDKYSFCHY